MKKFYSLILAIFLLSILAVPTAMALTFKAGENLTLDEPLRDDVYVAGGNIVVERNISGDLFVAGGVVTINGNIGQDLTIAGGRVTIMGNVGDDLRVFAGNVVLAGTVGGDLILGGGQIDIGKDSIVYENMMLGGGYVNFAGEVKGNVKGGVGMFFMNGEVGKDVVLTVQEKMEVSKDARIGGELKYTSIVKSDIPEGVVKRVVFNKIEKQAEDKLAAVTYAFLGYQMLSFLSALVFVLIFVLVMPKALIRSGLEAKAMPFKTFGIGAAAIIGGFLGAILLMATVIGIPLGVILFVLVFMAMYFAKIFAAAFLAVLAFKFERIKKYFKTKLFFAMALGLFVFYLLQFIPFIGWLFYLFLFLLGIGSMLMLKKNTYMFMRDKKQL